MSPPGWSNAEWADRIAGVLAGARYVNLGVGLPSKLPQFLADRPGLLFHCENGILGTGPEPPEGDVVAELIDASSRPVSLQA
ncbi:MAG: succinyl-CoA--3-ketoacid-CoA transferase, partial [Acidimicrobiia bacterium]